MECDLAAAPRFPVYAPSSGSPPPSQASPCAPTARRDQPGAALKLEARFYNKLVDHFHSPAVQLDRLAALWTQTVLRLFPQPLRINGRCVVVGDGIKVPKRGRTMPGVKLLHQHSEFDTKPELSALMRTDPLLSMQAGPADAHKFVTCCAASRSLFDAAW